MYKTPKEKEASNQYKWEKPVIGLVTCTIDAIRSCAYCHIGKYCTILTLNFD
jgi:hypothetical protein